MKDYLATFLSIKHHELPGKSETTQRIIRESMERVIEYYKKVKPKQLEIWP